MFLTAERKFHPDRENEPRSSGVIPLWFLGLESGLQSGSGIDQTNHAGEFLQDRMGLLRKRKRVNQVPS